MTPPLDRAVFRAGGETYRCLDVLLAGALWGDWEALERETREGLACLRHAQAAGTAPAERQVQHEAAEFRYARNLIAADEMLAWLERWGLSADEWTGYIRRVILRRRHAAELPAIVAAHPPAAPEVAAALWATAVGSGRLSRMARALAGRAAVLERLRADDDAAWRDADEAAVEGVRARIPADLAARGLAGLDEARLRERGAVVARLEAAFRHYRTRLLTPKVVAEQVGAHHLDWIRVRFRALAFAEEAMAREAALCVREDGLDLAAVAADAGAPLREGDSWLDEMGGAVRDHLLAARAGDVVGPLREDGGFALYHVAAKRLPTPDDPDVRRRAERQALRHALERETSARVQWVERM